jgi:TP901 family phage tail tape measure protein
MDHVGRRAGVLDRGLHKLGKAAMYAGAAVGGALVVGMAEGVKQASEFQASMTKISTQAGGTAKDVKVLSKAVLDMGRTAQQGPKELADSLYHLKSVGMGNAQAMKALRQASDLAAVGGANMEETTNALAGAWRTGIKGAGSFHEAVSTVNAIIGAGNMRMEDFNAAIGTGILASAKTFNLSLKSVGSALALMTDEGIPADAAATRLRMSFSLLAAPSAAAEKQLRKIGLSGRALGVAMDSPDGLIMAIQLLSDHLKSSGLDAVETSQLLSRAFGGGRSSSGIMTLLNNLDVLKLKQKQVNDSVGRFDDAVKAQRKTAQAQWKLLVSNLEVLSVKVGTAILPPITQFVSYLSKTALPAVVHFGQGLVDKLLPKGAFDSAGKTFEGFFAGLSGKGPAVIPAPKLGVPQGQSLAQPLSQAQKFGKALHDTALNLVKDWTPVAKAAGGIALAFMDIVTHTPAPVFQTIVDVMIATAITNKILQLTIAFKGLGRAMATSWLAALGPIGLTVLAVSGLTYVIGRLMGAWQGLGGMFTFFGEGFAQIGRGLATAGRAIAHFFDRKNGTLSNAISGANHWLYGVGRMIVEGLWSGVTSMWSGLGRQFSGIKDAVVGWLEHSFGIASPARVMMPIGANIIRGLLSGALGVAVGIGGWLLAHVKSPFTGAFRRAGGWLPGAGGRIVSGLLSGAGSVASGIGGWLSGHVKSPVIGFFSRSGSWLSSKGAAVINGLLSGMKGPYEALKKWVSGIAGWIKAHKGPISLDRRLLHPAGVALMSGLLRGLKFGFGPVGDFVYKAGGSVADTVQGIFGKLSGGTSGANQRLGKLMMQAKGWSADQWPALRALWMGESGWRAGALNKSSGAYGIPQALPASKMASAGKDWKSSAATQIKWGLGYIQGRYGSPGAAYSAWLGRSPHWYAKGTGGAAKGLAWVGEKGAELVNFKGGEDVLSHPDSMAFAKANGIKLPGYASGTILNAADRVRRDRQRVEDAKDNVARAKRRHKGVAAAEKQLKAAEKALQAAEISLKNARRSAKISIANTIATGLVKTLSTGTSSAIASAVKSLSTKLLNAGYDKLARSVLKTGDKLEKLANKRDALEKKIAEAKQYASDQTGNIKDFLSVSGTSATSVGGLISSMKGQQKIASDFAAEMKSLKARGASKDLLDQLAQAGPGSQLATTLANRSVTTGDISQLNKLMKSGNKLATGFGRDMADMMFDSGKNASKGFLTGLKSQEKELQKEMDSLGKALVKAIKEALGIKSPSAVMRDEVGWQVGAGMVAGMDAHRPHIAAAARRMADTARTAKIQAATAVGSVSGSGTASAQMPKVEVHVHVDDPTLRDLIRVEVKPLIRASEQKQAHEAKVGRR